MSAELLQLESSSPVLETHELPARVSSVRLIKPPLTREHARDAVRTRQLDLHISPALVLDPDPRSDVLEPLKARGLKAPVGEVKALPDTAYTGN